ncbi:MAG: UTP--glucose-1-phosphate uridylyltransferase [Planctomycetales bacterium]|nr:UTP--glucose-1-phosphate uridylyltransferase [Planctomycetales bacterium]
MIAAADTLTSVIKSNDESIRNLSLDSICADKSIEWMRRECESLDQFRRTSNNLYERVRALFFLAAIYRYHLPSRLPVNQGQIPFDGFCHLLNRRFAEAIEIFLRAQQTSGPSDALASSLASAYHQLAFQTLADQVRHSVRTFRGNQWMFRVGHPLDQPLRVQSALIPTTPGVPAPLMVERTAVRMDLSHSAWSDIFFLGMDYPDGARVMNVSVNLGVKGRDAAPRPPIEAYLRVIDQPVLRLASIDLGAQTELTQIDEVFDFARDYLGLLKAAVIAAGIVPPGMEGCGRPLDRLFERMIGKGYGLELVSSVNDIPKGSRLAVSTNLLGALISVCMRATGQVDSLSGPLTENDRRTVAARAILGEWLGGSGGGWQDSGGVWPGIKIIRGVAAQEGDPEFGVSRGCLLPRHQVLDLQSVSAETRQRLADSLVLVHGGMAQNVGPILEMVTEKYLLRSDAEWQARQDALGVLDEITAALHAGDIRRLGKATTRNFFGPLQTIIPWCADRFTEHLISATQEHFGEKFWGFWMLGGMAGGGMGFIFEPATKATAQEWLQEKMIELKRRYDKSLPYAMTPVVYDFSINDAGSSGELLEGDAAMMPDRYYAMFAPQWLRSEPRLLSTLTRLELERFGDRCRDAQPTSRSVQTFLEHILPARVQSGNANDNLYELLQQHGFDAEMHEQIRSDLRAGRIGLAQNRLPANVQIEDVRGDDVTDVRTQDFAGSRSIGEAALERGEVGVITLAAGVGSRWTRGAGVVKALNPFCKFASRHRNFIEVHLAKSRRVWRQFGQQIPHVVTTSYMTEQPLRDYFASSAEERKGTDVYVSSGKSIGLRMIPMSRDLQFAWEELPQQVLDEQQEKVRSSLRAALIGWAREMGEGNDYTDNLPLQCMHPVGHWYEFPNMLRNGTLAEMLERQPQLKYLLLHNIDTLGASLDPTLLGLHIAKNNCLSFEVVARRLEDRGGGLARVNGQVRILEGLAIPREEDEFGLSFYNSMSTWIHIDKLLEVFGLTRDQLRSPEAINPAIRRVARMIPTYTTIKDVKKRWGHGQEDIFPVSQFEKLWSDMSGLPNVQTGYFVVPLVRGQQLKEPSQLDGWLRDGSAAHVNELCEW